MNHDDPTPLPLRPVPPPPRWLWLQRLLVRAFWVGVVLALGSVVWGLWYVNEKGFTSRWRRKVAEELERRGVYADIGRLTLNPLRGVVAKEVKIRGKRSHRSPALATVSELVLDIDYSKLFRGEQFVQAVDLHHATLSWPVDRRKPKRDQLKVEGLNARLLLAQNQLTLVRGEARIMGVQVSASGQIFNPGALGSLAKKDAGKPDAPLEPWVKLLENLEKLKTEDKAPRLEIRFKGDALAPELFYAEAVFHADRFTIDDAYHVDGAHIVVTYRDKAFRLEQCRVVDRLGDLKAAGTFRPVTGEVSFALRSSIDIQALLQCLDSSWKSREINFLVSPWLELNGAGVLRSQEEGGPTGKIVGRFGVGRFSAKSIVFEGAGAEFAWDNGRWYVRDARVFHHSGKVSTHVLNQPGEFRFLLDSAINPKVLIPLLPARVAKELNVWEFQTAPVIYLEGLGPGLGMDGLEMKGRLALGKTSFRGKWMESLTSNLHFKDGLLVFPDFRIERTEGYGSGYFDFNFKREVATLKGVRSTMKPQDVAVWIDADQNLPRVLAPYRFRKPPNLLIEGTVQIHDCSDNTLLRVDVDGSDFDYHFLGKDLFFPKVNARLWVIQEYLTLENVRAKAYGGQVKGWAHICLTPGMQDYTAHLEAEDVDFASLTKLYLDYESSKGKMRGEFKFTGKGDSGRSIVGAGKVSVQDGNVFDIPLFGPFSGILNSILPGSGYHVANRASTDFEMRDGVITARNFTVDGKGFSMLGGGKLFFLDDKIDFTIRINAQGPAGLLLTPVSKLFEYVSDDSLSKPHWRPRHLPKAMFKAP